MCVCVGGGGGGGGGVKEDLGINPAYLYSAYHNICVFFFIDRFSYNGG